MKKISKILLPLIFLISATSADERVNLREMSDEQRERRVDGPLLATGISAMGLGAMMGTRGSPSDPRGLIVMLAGSAIAASDFVSHSVEIANLKKIKLTLNGFIEGVSHETIDISEGSPYFDFIHTYEAVELLTDWEYAERMAYLLEEARAIGGKVKKYDLEDFFRSATFEGHIQRILGDEDGQTNRLILRNTITVYSI